MWDKRITLLVVLITLSKTRFKHGDRKMWMRLDQQLCSVHKLLPDSTWLRFEKLCGSTLEEKYFRDHHTFFD